MELKISKIKKESILPHGAYFKNISNSSRTTRINSTTRKRPYTSFKKYNFNLTSEIQDKNSPKVIYEYNSPIVPLNKRNTGQNINTENSANLYFDKSIFKFYKNKKQKTTLTNDYFEKEELLDRLIKVKTDMNKLSKKYIKQKIENELHIKEIKRQNKLLNELNKGNINEKNNITTNNISNNSYKGNNVKNKNDFFSNYIKNNKINNKTYINNNNFNNSEKINILEYSDRRHISNEKRNKLIKSLSGIKLEDNLIDKKNKDNFNDTQKKQKITFENLRTLYNSMNKFNNKKESEINILLNENMKLKTNKETLLSNLKLYCSELKKSIEQKDQEIAKLKKNIKCTNYEEVLREREIFEKEMIKLKIKLNNYLREISEYKKHKENNQELIEIIKQKDKQINILEIKINNLSNISEKNIKNYESIIEQKEKEINRLNNENLKSKIHLDNLSLNESYINKSKKDIFYQLYIEMRKRGINSSQTFTNEVLNKVENFNPINKNKIIFSDLIIKLFNIKDTKSKNIILRFANQEFDVPKSLKDIKNKIIETFDKYFDKNIIYKTNKELFNYIKSNIDIGKLKKEFEKYDIENKQSIDFNQMTDIINEFYLNEVSEELLLLTKDRDIFNQMNYNFLFELLKNKDSNSNIKNNLLIIKCDSINIIKNKLINDIKNYEEIDSYKNNEELITQKNKNKEMNKKIDNIFKNLSVIIKKEGSTPDVYLSSLKKEIDIYNTEDKREKKFVDAIEIESFDLFLKSKNIEIDNEDKENLFFEYGLKHDEGYKGDEKYLNFKKVTSKLFMLIKNS